MQDGFISLAYGRAPLTMKMPGRPVRILEANHVPGVPNVREEFRRAMAGPIGSRRLRDLVGPASRAALIVSDRTRDIPRQEMIRAALEEMPGIPDRNIVIVIACGNHPPSTLESLDLGVELPERFRIVIHSSTADEEMVSIGKTSAGTEVRINRAAAEADIKVLLGQIKPHYFTGYSGGAKSILPGVSSIHTIGPNHLMKSGAGARLGTVEGNPVRADMEEAARLAGKTYILNIVMNQRKQVVRAVAGDVVEAHREGVRWARRVCEVPAHRSEVVIVSEGLPGSMNLYQASKLLAPSANVLEPGGVVVLAAECHEGIGPLPIVNEVIYRRGLCQVLPAEHRILLVSALPRERVAETFCEYASSLEEALITACGHTGPSAEMTVIPRGGLLIPLPAA